MILFMIELIANGKHFGFYIKPLIGELIWDNASFKLQHHISGDLMMVL